MDPKSSTLEELAAKGSGVGKLNALIGFDGFIDKIVTPVKTRSGAGDQFEAMDSLKDFGDRISAAAGKSVNIELYPKVTKLGGNGPIMANALVSAGAQVRYIGALGYPEINPVFQEFARKTQAKSITEPGVTVAVETYDGKAMLGTTASLDLITYERLTEAIGEGNFFDMVNRADLLAVINWTMTPHLTSLLASIVDKVLPNLGPKETGRTFFFDLCDPVKRTDSDLRSVLSLYKRFRNYGQVILGLNFAEGHHVARVLDLGELENTAESLQAFSEKIRQKLDLTCVVIHPVNGAACSYKGDTAYVDGPYTDKPRITTGAGDHFNAGFCTGLSLGMSPLACLTVAVSFSGHYVRTAESPSLQQIDSFIRNWQNEG